MNTLRLLLVVPALLAGTATAPAQGVVIRAQPEQQQGDAIAELLERAQKAHAAGKTREAAELMAKAQAMLTERVERQAVERRDRAEAQRRALEAQERARVAEQRAREQRDREQRDRAHAEHERAQAGQERTSVQDPERKAELHRLRQRVAELEAEVARRRAQGGGLSRRAPGPRGEDAPQLGLSEPRTYRLSPQSGQGEGGMVIRRAPQGPSRVQGVAPGPRAGVAPDRRADAAPQRGHDVAPQRGRDAAPQHMDATQRLLRGIHEELRGIREELSGIRESLSGGAHGTFQPHGGEGHPQPFGVYKLQGEQPGHVFFSTPQGAPGAWLHLESLEELGETEGILHDLTELHEVIQLEDVTGLHGETLELQDVEDILELELRELEEVQGAIELEVETVIEEKGDGSRQLRVIAVPQVETGGGSGGGPTGNVRYRVRRGGGGAGTTVPAEPVLTPVPVPTPPAPPLPPEEQPAPEPVEQPQPDATSAFLPVATTAVETR